MRDAILPIEAGPLSACRAPGPNPGHAGGRAGQRSFAQDAAEHHLFATPQTLTQKSLQAVGKLRALRLSPGYAGTKWCAKPHVIYCFNLINDRMVGGDGLEPPTLSV